MKRYLNFITSHEYLKKIDFKTKWRLRQLKLFDIEERYRVFDKFGRPEAEYDDAVWISNRFLENSIVSTER